MSRWQLIGLVAAAIASGSLSAHAQRQDSKRDIAVMIGLSEAHPDTKAFLREFSSPLEVLGSTSLTIPPSIFARSDEVIE